MRRLAWFLALVALLAAGTWVAGWWAVPLVAAVWSLARRPTSPAVVGLAAALAWGLLLLTLPWDDLGRLTHRLGGVFSVPGVVPLGLTLAFSGLLGWSSARLVARRAVAAEQ